MVLFAFLILLTFRGGSPGITKFNLKIRSIFIKLTFTFKEGSRNCWTCSLHYVGSPGASLHLTRSLLLMLSWKWNGLTRWETRNDKDRFEIFPRFLVGHLSSPGSIPQSPSVLRLSRKSSPGPRAEAGQDLSGKLDQKIKNISEESWMKSEKELQARWITWWPK